MIFITFLLISSHFSAINLLPCLNSLLLVLVRSALDCSSERQGGFGAEAAAEFVHRVEVEHHRCHFILDAKNSSQVREATVPPRNGHLDFSLLDALHYAVGHPKLIKHRHGGAALHTAKFACVYEGRTYRGEVNPLLLVLHFKSERFM